MVKLGVSVVCPLSTFSEHTGTYRVEEGDADVLDDAVEGHELEHTEGGDESSAALSVEKTKQNDDGGSSLRFYYHRRHFTKVTDFVSLASTFRIHVQSRGLRTAQYLMRLGTQEMLGVLEVKGEATEASSSEREIPPWALFSA